MQEDKLEPEQRRRLESLAQANMTCMGLNNEEHILTVAKKYDHFIVTGEVVELTGQ